MKIRSIEIKNLGPFFGVNYLDFDTKSNQPIVLIGGNNGSGKSTLFKLIKLGLHGHYAMGFKVQSNIYFDKISHLINNYIEFEDYAGITINLELDEDYIKNNYTLKRYWYKTEKGIEEVYEVYLNNNLLSVTDTEDFSNKLLYKIPLSLLETSFLDGEEIINLLKNEEMLSNFLRANFNIHFDLELFSILESDLNKFIKSELLESKNSSENKKLLLEMEKIETIAREIDLIKSEKNRLLSKSLDIKKSISILKKDLNKLGKLDEIDKNILLSKLSNHEKAKEKYYKDIKRFLEDDYALYLNSNLLEKISKEIQNEKSLKFAKYIEEIIKSEIVTQYKPSLQEIKNTLCLNTTKPLIYSMYNIETMIIEIIESKKSKYQIDNYKKYTILKEEIAAIKDKLENDKKANSYVNKISLLRDLKEDLLIIDEIILNLDNRLNILIEEKGYLEGKYNQYLLLNKLDLRNNNSIKMADKIIKLSKTFKESQINKYMERIESESTRIFKKVIHKPNFIDSIVINHDNFSVRLLKDNNLEKISFLSTGEQQILISSIIWAFHQLSNKKMQFIIDTPLARLDNINKLSYIRDLLSTISNQVIILSTDSEIDEELYSQIKDKVYREYLFENNGLNTKIKNHYFGFGVKLL